MSTSHFVEFLSLSLMFSHRYTEAEFFHSSMELMLCSAQCTVSGNTKYGYVLLLVILTLILC